MIITWYLVVLTYIGPTVYCTGKKDKYSIAKDVRAIFLILTHTRKYKVQRKIMLPNSRENITLLNLTTQYLRGGGGVLHKPMGRIHRGYERDGAST